MPTLQPKKDAKPKREPKPKPPGRKPPGGKGKPGKEPNSDQIVKGGDGPSDHPN